MFLGGCKADRVHLSHTATALSANVWGVGQGSLVVLSSALVNKSAQSTG